MSDPGFWDEIALGNATPAEARALVRSVGDGLTLPMAQRLYDAFRAWTWKALDQRRRDASLRQWHQLLQSTDALLAADYPLLAAQVATLAELVYESVAVEEIYGLEDALRRPYVVDLLLAFLHDGPSSRDDVAHRCPYPRENTALILNLMRNCGLVSSSTDGTTELFELTGLGEGKGRDVEQARNEDRQRQTIRVQKRSTKRPPARSMRRVQRGGRLSKEPSHRERGQTPSQIVLDSRISDPVEDIDA